MSILNWTPGHRVADEAPEKRGQRPRPLSDVPVALWTAPLDDDRHRSDHGGRRREPV